MKKFAKLITLVLVLVFAVAIFAGCAPSSAEKAKAKMEKAGYVVVQVNSPVADGDVVATITATRNLKDTVVATWYKDSATAKKYYNDAVKKEDKKDSVIKLSGKCVYVATSEAAAKDFA